MAKKSLILIDAISISNFGGGFILLKYLIRTIHKTDLKVFYLLDNRCKGHFEFLDDSCVKYLKSSRITRFKFYLTHRCEFNTVLCFANVPPPIRLKSKVLTYFHNVGYFFYDHDTFVQKIVKKMKFLYIRLKSRNTDYWIVQTELVKLLLNNQFASSTSSTLIYPFFEYNVIPKNNRDCTSYLYVSSFSEYKNHIRLFNAWRNFYYNTNCKVSLYVTIPSHNIDIIRKINEEEYAGIGIVNLGIIPKKELLCYYEQCSFHIFPSLFESFGLGLIEACEYNQKILASDLPYVYEVVEPSDTFDPFSEASIYNCLLRSKLLEKESNINVSDRVKELIKLLM